MKKVLHILPSDRFSGAENVVCQIIQMFRIRKNDYEMIYCCPDGPIRFALQERNIDSVLLDSLSIANIKRVIKQTNPDIIHVHDMKASFFVALSCGKIPMISHIHNNNFDARKPTLKAILYFCAAIKARHIFWVSKSSMKDYCFHRWFGKKSSLLRNIINPQEAQRKADLSPDKNEFDIVYIGRLTYQKNPQRLVSIMKNIAEQIPNVKMAIVGSGELEEETQKAVEAVGLSHCVSFLGFMTNPLGILERAKLMIMVSRWEGTPMCALEAMALGVPIVSTPTDGLKELTIDGVTGYLSDDDGVLSDRCVQVVKDSELRDRLSQETRIRALEIMNIDQYVEQIKEVYEQNHY